MRTCTHTITVMSHERYRVSNHRQLKCLFNKVLGLRFKKDTQAHIDDPLWGESTGWMSLTKGQQCGNHLVHTYAHIHLLWCVNVFLKLFGRMKYYVDFTAKYSYNTSQHCFFLTRSYKKSLARPRIRDMRCLLAIMTPAFRSVWLAIAQVIDRPTDWLTDCRSDHSSFRPSAQAVFSRVGTEGIAYNVVDISWALS